MIVFVRRWTGPFTRIAGGLFAALFTAAAQSPNTAPSTPTPESFQSFRHDRHGFVIKLPPGWVEVAGSSLDHLNELLRTKVGSPYLFPYFVGYQRDPGPPWMVYPYVLVQVNERQRMQEAELARLKSTREGIEEGVAKVQSKLDTMISKAKLGELIYDADARILWLNLDAQVEGIGPVRGISGILLSEKGYVQVSCYATKATFSDLSDTFKQIIRGVTLDPNLQYRPHALDAFPWLQRFSTNPVFTYAVIGAIVGGAVSVVAQLMKGRKRHLASESLPPPLPPEQSGGEQDQS